MSSIAINFFFLRGRLYSRLLKARRQLNAAAAVFILRESERLTLNISEYTKRTYKFPQQPPSDR